MSSDTIHIQEAELADLEIIVRFNEMLASESENKILDHETVMSGVRKALNDPNKCSYFIARINGAVVGQMMITLEWSDWRNGYFWWIQSVYVEKDFRRQGVFRAIYQHVGDLARQEINICGLRLYVHKENEHAIQTYKNLGMAVTDYLLYEEDWPASS